MNRCQRLTACQASYYPLTLLRLGRASAEPSCELILRRQISERREFYIEGWINNNSAWKIQHEFYVVIKAFGELIIAFTSCFEKHIIVSVRCELKIGANLKNTYSLKLYHFFRRAKEAKNSSAMQFISLIYHILLGEIIFLNRRASIRPSTLSFLAPSRFFSSLHASSMLKWTCRVCDADMRSYPSSLGF